MNVTVKNSDQARSWALAVREVAVIGAGTMGEGIAQSFAEAGLMVRLIDIASGPLERCKLQIAENLALAETYGLPFEDSKTVIDRIHTIKADEPAGAVGGSGVVIETVPEIPELKRDLFAKLDSLPDDVLLASNTSSMTMTDVCATMRSAERAVGMHYFNPAHIIPAVEVHRSGRTSEKAVAYAQALLARCRKTAVLVKKEMPGLVLNRLTGALYREIAHLLDVDAITPEELDAGVRASLGFRLAWVGPMQGEDFIGLDTSLRVSRAVFPQLSNRTDREKKLTELVKRGDLGVKTGRGWYDYGETTRAQLLRERNAKLLRQLKAFREAEKS